MGWLLKEIPQRLFNDDQGFLRTFIDMSVRPGKVSQAYIDGKRRRYLNPFSYYLVAAAAQLIALFIVSERLAKALAANVTDAKAEELRAAGITDPYTFVAERYEFLIQNAYTWLGLVTLVLPSTLMLWLFLRKRANFAEVAVFCLFTQSHVILVSGLMNPITTSVSLTLHSVLAIVLYFSYMIWGARVCFGSGFVPVLGALVAMSVGYVCFTFTLVTGHALLINPAFF